jgi:hypothetical protein
MTSTLRNSYSTLIHQPKSSKPLPSYALFPIIQLLTAQSAKWQPSTTAPERTKVDVERSTSILPARSDLIAKSTRPTVPTAQRSTRS